jgi:hypothetical protein
MGADETRHWKDGIYGLMALWGLEPGDLVMQVEEADPSPEASDAYPILM